MQQAAVQQAAVQQAAAHQAAGQQALAVLMSLAVPVISTVPVPPPPASPSLPALAPAATPTAISIPALAAAAWPEEAARRPSRLSGWARLGTGRGWPIGLVLAAQAALSLRLIWSDSAFPDEALYLYVGRQELGRWLPGIPHLAAIPDFASYLSGAPVLYPPLGAAADRLGGLAGARLLSLAIMLAVTVLLHGVTRRLFDRPSAFFATALFAGLAATAFLGAFATYDAMSLGLLALATWLGLAAASRPGAAQAGLAAAAGAVLALANGTKYASGLFDPVVLSVTALAIWRGYGAAAAARTAGLMLGVLGCLLGGGLLAGGRTYWHGVATTTLVRPPGSESPVYLLYMSGKWVGAVALLAVIGAAVTMTSRRGWPLTAMSWILAAAVAAAPVQQARIETYTSMFKHDGYGAWFACIVAGYAVASLARAVPRAKARAAFGAGIGLMLLAAGLAFPTAAQHFGWPESGPMIARMSGVLARNPGPVLSDDRGDLLHYYLGPEVAGRTVVGTWWFRYLDPATGQWDTGLRAYRDAIRRQYFGVIVLSFWDTLATDDQLQRTIVRSGYLRVASLPYDATGTASAWSIWVRERRA